VKIHDQKVDTAITITNELASHTTSAYLQDLQYTPELSLRNRYNRADTASRTATTIDHNNNDVSSIRMLFLSTNHQPSGLDTLAWRDLPMTSRCVPASCSLVLSARQILMINVDRYNEGLWAYLRSSCLQTISGNTKPFLFQLKHDNVPLQR